MVLYTCDICCKEYKNKSDYIRHINRKYKCVKNSTNQIQNENNKLKLNLSVNCNICKKEFKNSHSIYRHKKYYCKEKIKNESNQHILENKINVLNNELNTLKNINIELTNKNKELLKENKILLESLKNNSTNNSNTTNIQINKYKKQKISATVRNLVWNTYFKTIDAICTCCNHEKISRGNFQCGHIISEKHGGTLNISNLKPICALCNTSMGTMNMNDFIHNNNLYSVNS
jgi:hypothetical protein